MHIVVIDTEEYRSNFADLQDIPLYPYEFSCNSNDNSLFECSRYVASCYSSSTSHYGDYAGVTCQGNNFTFCTIISNL